MTNNKLTDERLRDMLCDLTDLVGEFDPLDDNDKHNYEMFDEMRSAVRELQEYRNAQQVVPDVLERLRSIVSDPRALPRRKEWISGQQYSYVLLENVRAMVDDACRAALQSGAVKDGWVACSERMPEEGGRYFAWVTQQNSLGLSAWADNVGYHPDDIGFRFNGVVTHWQPLPAAPQQEVKP